MKASNSCNILLKKSQCCCLCSFALLSFLSFFSLTGSYLSLPSSPFSGSSTIPPTKCQGNVTLIILQETPGPIWSSPLLCLHSLWATAFVCLLLKSDLSHHKIRLCLTAGNATANSQIHAKKTLFFPTCSSIYVMPSQIWVVSVINNTR